MRNQRTLADLQEGETVFIAANQERNIPLKMVQMGCTSNTEVTLIMKAPSKDPICIQFGGNDVAIRLHIARKIVISNS